MINIYVIFLLRTLLVPFRYYSLQKLSSPKEADIPFSSISKIDSSKQKEFQKLPQTPKQFGSRAIG